MLIRPKTQSNKDIVNRDDRIVNCLGFADERARQNKVIDIRGLVNHNINEPIKVMFPRKNLYI